MTKNDVYRSLEKQMVKYSDLKSVVIKECNENFVALPSTGKGVIGIYSNKLDDMKNDFPLISVRETVYKKLQLVNQGLKKIDPSLQLLVTYGYRSMEVQEKYFSQFYQKLKGKYSTELELLEAVHKLIAVPTVAGHPTGGAVDVTILKNGKEINMGTEIYDFSSKDIYSLSPFVSEKVQKNRNLLRTVMMKNNFAPFDGEWWHYSYGDKEWACYYNKPNATYRQKTVQEVLKEV
ncbi:MAG: D-alanyl-D-alanine carboxypeptidase family protein [Candidatus Pacebacteria bacterium]|nr:D-alanyl-D-alanine carboxypeptidase family protein [Candidatus Paceibacterota bacterium]